MTRPGSTSSPGFDDSLMRAASGGRVLLTGPADPDGDSLGACLALARAVVELGGAPVVAGTPGPRYRWLPGARQMVPEADLRGPFDLAVVVDGDRTRLHPQVGAAYDAAGQRALLDHHRSTRAEGYDLWRVEPSVSSSCELVLSLMDAWGLPLDPEVAVLLYAGLVFDTGCFRHPSTTPATHLAAARLVGAGIDHSAIALKVLWERRPAGTALLAQALGGARAELGGEVAWAVLRQADLQRHSAEASDLEGVVDSLLLTAGVELAALLVERGPALVRLSLRSRSRVAVSAPAARIAPGGGGHRRAAGAMLPWPLPEADARMGPALVAAARG